MWKDAEGNIVTKRPNSTASQQQRRNEVTPGVLPSHQSESGAPISPPISTSNSYGRSYSDDQEAPVPSDDLWAFAPLNIHPLPPADIYQPPVEERFWSSDLPVPIVQTQSEDVPYDDIFNPDTASSFNMPFTTMSNYSWLFDVDLSSHQDHVEPSSLVTRDFSHCQVPIDIQNHQSNSNYSSEVPPEPSTTCGNLAIIQENPSVPSNQSESSYFGTPSGPIISPPFTDLGSRANKGFEFDNPSVQPSQLSNNSTSGASAEVRRDSIISRTFPQTKPSTVPPPDVERPMSMLQRSRSLPVIDELARAQTLDLIDAARPVTPDGSYITRDHPLLSLSSLQTYCDLYFTRFNTAYPLIHQATFDASHIETLLLVSVLLVGATYCEKDAHQLAVCIHDVLRPQIFANDGFTARPEIWVLQTILLVECFGKSRAGQKQHDMAHLFHGLLINLIRRSDCQSIRPPTVEEGTDDLEDDWRTWAEAEQKKRLAFLCFMWDTQHAVLFCQSLCMSAFELRSTLPCDQSVWEADSAEYWQQLRKQQKPPPLFLSCLKTYLTPGGPPSPKNINALSRVLLLHGLMSVSWDMKRRDQTSLGLMGTSTPIGNWKTRMTSSYDAWKTDFDSYCLHYTSHLLPTHPSLRKEFACFTTANNAIYHAAHVILNAEFLDLQIYAGARHILGRPVTRPDYVRSQRIVKRWATEDALSAATAAWHAACVIRDGVMNLEGFDAMGLFHFPWCLYLCTLTCWAFHHARPSEASASDAGVGLGAGEQQGHGATAAGDDEDEIIWDAKAEMNALISGMTSQTPEGLAKARGRRRTSGLTAVVAKCLSKVRWAVVHDGMMVLRGLVPWRLINQYESLA
ncbi:hypothetical protein K432DRAFT_415193 [Lepidopterella palustris CBS 459.81]|uniref:Xylanolytic transcriptional activator regulatory domain-containing protein n=1 Tax=Lepidopterella palustris CBS 459.81 TaxID=1314670 RepID=A0A8E2EEU9_9PEZI|nr:hypothetical protein K432DRAFT_415193 [Lepidopterella palustris CBS 459.81]